MRVETGVGEVVVAEQPGTVTPGSGELVSPSRQQCDVEAPGCGLIDDLDNAVEVSWIGLGWIVIDERGRRPRALGSLTPWNSDRQTV